MKPVFQTLVYVMSKYLVSVPIEGMPIFQQSYIIRAMSRTSRGFISPQIALDRKVNEQLIKLQLRVTIGIGVIYAKIKKKDVLIIISLQTGIEDYYICVQKINYSGNAPM